MSLARLILVTHGTRDPQGQATYAELRRAVAVRLRGVTVELACVDLVEPHLVDLAANGPAAVVVPVFLGHGYHVRTDLPRALEAAAPGTVVTEPLGPDPLLTGGLVDRLTERTRDVDVLVLAAAGSRDPGSQRQARTAAGWLANAVKVPVYVGYASAAEPRVAAVLAAVCERGFHRPVVVSYLLAPGHFARRIAQSSPAVTTAPLGTHASVVQTIVERWEAARLGC